MSQTLDPGPEVQGFDDLALLHLAFMTEIRNATWVNVLSSNVRTLRVRIVVHTVDALYTRLCCFTLSAVFLYLFFTLQTQE